MKVKGDINKMIRNKTPQGVFPWAAMLNYSARDTILLVMSPTRHQGREERQAFPGHQYKQFREKVQKKTPQSSTI